ncbi:leucine-rich_repeat domain-containing protein [Hexamita inflata]|uniref:Leucine-rich repeat domain-containing protein n=1 Tax=Hexamita inflata TaxID=28002 RepID=A0AA86NB31_9EUKA|nr:leucine-rich repeat domain-containing protein [Hexamita inflata]
MFKKCQKNQDNKSNKSKKQGAEEFRINETIFDTECYFLCPNNNKIYKFEDTKIVSNQLCEQLHLCYMDVNHKTTTKLPLTRLTVDNGKYNIDCAIDLKELSVQNCAFTYSFPHECDKLTSLTLNSCNLSNIDFLTNYKNLDTLLLFHNNLTDISVLATMKNLRYVNLNRNQIQLAHPLRNLSKLQHLKLDGNKIRDLLFVFNLKNLELLHLRSNQISDLNQFVFILDTKFYDITYTDNPIYTTHKHQIDQIIRSIHERKPDTTRFNKCYLQYAPNYFEREVLTVYRNNILKEESDLQNSSAQKKKINLQMKNPITIFTNHLQSTIGSE